MRTKSCYVHHLPGRLRVRIPAAKGDPITAEMLAKRINHVEGISSVTANAVTGSILIHYNTAVTNAAACLAVLDVTPMGRAAAGPSATHRLTRKIAEAAMWYIAEKTVERCFLLLLAALI